MADVSIKIPIEFVGETTGKARNLGEEMAKSFIKKIEPLTSFFGLKVKIPKSIISKESSGLLKMVDSSVKKMESLGIKPTDVKGDEVGGISKIAGSMAKMVVIGVAIVAAVGIIAKQVVKASPYLQGILSVFSRSMLIFFRPFGDFLATHLKPLAVALMKLSVAWLKFTRTPEGKVVAAAGTGVGVGAGIGAIIGGFTAGPAGAAIGALIGAMIGAFIALIPDAVKGIKNLGIVAKAWLDYFADKVFGIDMDKVRVAVVTFIYRTLPDFFTKTIPDLINQGWEQIKGLGDWLWKKIKTVWNYKEDLGPWLWNKIKSIWNYVSDFGSWIWEKIKSVWNYTSDLGTWLWNLLINAFSNIPRLLGNLGTFLKDLIEEVIKSAITGLKSSAQAIIDSAKKIISNLIPKGSASGIISGVNSVVNSISNVVNSIVNKTTGNVYGASAPGWTPSNQTVSKTVSDAIITPSGIINTNPDDFIITTKNPQSLGKGNVVNTFSPKYYFNIPAYSISEVERQVRNGARSLEFDVRRRNLI